MAQIEFKNVRFCYPECEEDILKDISFKIYESEFILICGASGSGKTTLLKHMKKNMIPYGRGDGDILYNGCDIETMEDRKSVSEIGYVQQNPDNQIVTDKVWHELAFGLESLGKSTEEIRKKTAEIAHYFGMNHWFHSNTQELSGGQKQLLNLASVMIMQPKVLILDEPTAQLDPVSATKFLEMLCKINQDFGTTIILSEHRLEEIFSLADRVLILENGIVRAFEEPRKVAEMVVNTKNFLLYGMPSALKICAGVSQEEENIPLTVKEGRNWLLKSTKDVHLDNVKKLSRLQKKEQNKEINFMVQIKDVEFKYKKNSNFILNGIDLKVKKGESFAILGGNGEGKSTLLRVIAGVKRPQSGSVMTNGKVIMLPQNPMAIFTEITVLEELCTKEDIEDLFWMDENEVDNKEDIENLNKQEKVEKILKFMGLENHKTTNPYDLSGGEQQKLALAKVLLRKPDILLLDEPTKGLDPYFKNMFGSILKELQENGITLILVSHDIEFCAEYADRCAMIFDGQLISSGETREFFGENSFYTTAANKISRHIFKNCITCEQVIEEYKRSFGQ